MLLIVTVAVSAVALYALSAAVPAPSGLVSSNLGRMSQQWLAEYRASQAS